MTLHRSARARVTSLLILLGPAPAVAAAQAAPPERTVDYVVRSTSLPASEVRVAADLPYLGALHYEVASGARVEAFVFGDTAAGRLRRAFIAHFEGYPDSIAHTFRYPRLEMTRLGRREYLHQTWAFAQFSLFEEPAVQVLLRGLGLTAEPSWLVDRYVRVVDAAAKHEVIFFYLEAASLHARDSSIVYGGAAVAPPPPPTPPAAVTALLRQRAGAAFRVHDP